MHSVVLEIEGEFLDVAERAFVRMKSLYPMLRISLLDGTLRIEKEGTSEELLATDGLSLEDLKSEFFHLLYREKIFLETLPIRKWMYSKGE